MLDNLQNVFEYGESKIRVIVRDGEPWFVAKDVCVVLGLLNITESLKRIDRDDLSTTEVIDSIGRKQQVYIVSEPGLYVLVFESRKPEAKQFKKWVTSEVLPQIRKTGMYVGSYKIPQTYPEALRLAADLAEQNQKLLPKAEQYDKFISGDNYQAMNIVAKALGIGRNKLFRLLRDRRILMNNNTPYQQYIDAGYFVVKEKPIQMGGGVINKPQTYVTAKGVDWLSRLLDERSS